VDVAHDGTTWLTVFRKDSHDPHPRPHRHSAPEGSLDTLKALGARSGKVLNIHGAMAHSPAVLETYAAIQEALQDTGTFDGRTREAIALAVGNVDECSYCQAAHTAGGKAAGLSESETVDIRRGSVADPKLAALLTLVREQAANVGHVHDSTWQGALDAGWSDVELTETAAFVALNLFTNYFNHLGLLSSLTGSACRGMPLRYGSHFECSPCCVRTQGV